MSLPYYLRGRRVLELDLIRRETRDRAGGWRGSGPDPACEPWGAARREVLEVGLGCGRRGRTFTCTVTLETHSRNRRTVRTLTSHTPDSLVYNRLSLPTPKVS